LYRNWGAPFSGGWMEWPAAEFNRARAATNVYIALSGYRHATDKVGWCNANPEAWELVSYVFAMREGLL
jgi:hypothetical protein